MVDPRSRRSVHRALVADFARWDETPAGASVAADGIRRLTDAALGFITGTGMGISCGGDDGDPREASHRPRYQDCPMNGPAPLWNPYAAGALLGAGLLLTFVLTGHGLGASGATTALAAAGSQLIAPEATAANAYFGPMVADGRQVLDTWIVWQVIGVALGGLAGALSAGRFRWQVDGPRRLGVPARLLLAVIGGALAGFGARLSLGCTSGLGLSGASTLATAGFLFLIGFFATGAALGLLTRRLWQ
ncbi:YeeE/YedE thiosulfate transporter family protein [Sinimarinibacterium thermocellulolyticum]|uniref:YeeE/YedE thiosulfate transporter family protein n=1 Tax=Sinimarinibacterium thermocellulolyticum TaxID=3170016 RepID=A0ABV2ADC4_9GAMM